MTSTSPLALPKLLIVEDDPGLQAQLKWAYEDFEVFVAGDRQTAIAGDEHFEILIGPFQLRLQARIVFPATS